MLSQFIEDRYGDIIRDYEERLQKDQEQLQKKQEEIQKYKNILKNNGIVVE